MFVRIRSEGELTRALEILGHEGVPFFVLGGGANVLVADKGIRGAVIDLTGLDSIRLNRSGDDITLAIGAGAEVDTLCLYALSLGLAGLENFFGMPGTVGGAVYMNARCYERDFSESVGEILVCSQAGDVSKVRPAASSWSYKMSPFQPGGAMQGSIIVEVDYRMRRQPAEVIASVMRARKADRLAKGHYRFPSAGSVFKNDRSFGMPTGALLDKLGMKGLRKGDAAVSPWHANIFINMGHASASDMRSLIETAQIKALDAFGFELAPEILFVGEF